MKGVITAYGGASPQFTVCGSGDGSGDETVAVADSGDGSASGAAAAASSASGTDAASGIVDEPSSYHPSGNLTLVQLQL